MGLSSKQVSSDGFDWPQGMVKSGGVEIPQPTVPAQAVGPPQQQKQRHPATQQQGPPLRCPRCDSANTKFCYYNNYSRAQPRHFCKACRRHWTEGGTLRNVPVGGGRKAKRSKTSLPSSAADPATGHHGANRVDGRNATPTSVQQPPAPQIILPPLTFPQDILCPALLQPPSGYADGSYLGSLLSVPSTPQFAGGAARMVDGGSYPFSTSSTFHSFLNLAVGEDLAGMGSDTAITTATPPPWELLPPPTCSGGPSGSSLTTTSSGPTVLESSSPSSGYWGSCWDDLTGFLSADLQHPAASGALPPHHY